MIDEFRVVDKEPGHFFFEEVNTSYIAIFIISHRWLIAQIRPFTVVRFELLLGGSNIVFCEYILTLWRLIDGDFHLEIIIWKPFKIDLSSYNNLNRNKIFGEKIWLMIRIVKPKDIIMAKNQNSQRHQV